MPIKIVYYKPLAFAKGDELWAYTEDNGKRFGIVHVIMGRRTEISASREELEQILKNEEVEIPSERRQRGD